MMTRSSVYPLTIMGGEYGFGHAKKYYTDDVILARKKPIVNSRIDIVIMTKRRKDGMNLLRVTSVGADRNRNIK